MDMFQRNQKISRGAQMVTAVAVMGATSESH